jgi:hypothetical protein
VTVRTGYDQALYHKPAFRFGRLIEATARVPPPREPGRLCPRTNCRQALGLEASCDGLGTAAVSGPSSADSDDDLLKLAREQVRLTQAIAADATPRSGGRKAVVLYDVAGLKCLVLNYP